MPSIHFILKSFRTWGQGAGEEKYHLLNPLKTPTFILKTVQSFFKKEVKPYVSTVMKITMSFDVK